MRLTRSGMILAFGFILVGAWWLGVSTVGSAQTVPGSGSVREYDPMMARPSTIYGDFREIGPGRQPRTQQEQVTVLIKQGKKIYCAWSNQLLHNDVSFREVSPEQAEKFYDDGTHNDEIPFDGLPSNVEEDKYTYIGPYGMLIALELELLKNRILTLDTVDRIKIHQWEDRGKYDPLRFYSGLHVVSLDRKSPLPRFVEKLTDLTDYVEILDQDVLEQFRGYQPYSDREHPELQSSALRRFPNISDDPDMFEEMPEYAQEYWRWVQDNRPREVIREDLGFPGLGMEGAYYPLDRAAGAAGMY